MKILDQPYDSEMSRQPFRFWTLQCRLRIFQPHPEVQTVLITDLKFAAGWFIPCSIEKLINHVVEEFQLDPACLIWIEHYTARFRNTNRDEFCEVKVEWRSGKATRPHWRAIAPEVIADLIAEDEHWLWR